MVDWLDSLLFTALCWEFETILRTAAIVIFRNVILLLLQLRYSAHSGLCNLSGYSGLNLSCFHSAYIIMLAVYQQKEMPISSACPENNNIRNSRMKEHQI